MSVQFEATLAELQSELASWKEKHDVATSACAAAQEALSDMQKQNKALQTELDLKALLLGNANSGKQELQVCAAARGASQQRPDSTLGMCCSKLNSCRLTVHACCRWHRHRQSNTCQSCSCR